MRHNRHTRQRGLALFCVVLLKDCEPEELVPNQNFAIAAYPGVAQHISSMVRPRKLTASQTRDRRVVFLRGHGKAHGKAHGVGVRVASGRDHDA